MKLKRVLFLFPLLAVLLFQNTVTAEGFLRCQDRLVYLGDTKAKVLDKCGDPDQLDQWEEDHNSYISQIYDYGKEQYIAPKLIKGPILMERWTYNMGSNKFIRYLYFQNGELTKIETGEKGNN